jgi:outer membrane protein
MRKLSTIIAVVSIVLIAGIATGQDAKFGHIDLQALIQVMPERAKAEAEYTKQIEELEEQLGTMQQELETKWNDYMQKRDSLSDLIRNARESEIQEIQQRIRNFEMIAQQQLQQKQGEMLRPIFEKAQKAVQDVGKERGLIYVFDVSGELGTVLYRSSESIDVLPMVKQKLGIQ